MTSEPPFDHPPDHTKYGPPPLEPPRSLPWVFTPGFKSGCALIGVALMFTCCLSSVATTVVQGLMHRLDTINHHLEDISRKLDNVKAGPNKAMKEEEKKEEPKKEEPKKDEPKRDNAKK